MIRLFFIFNVLLSLILFLFSLSANAQKSETYRLKVDNFNSLNISGASFIEYNQNYSGLSNGKYRFFKITEFTYKENQLIISFLTEINSQESLQKPSENEKSCTMHVNTYQEFRSIVSDIENKYIIPFCEDHSNYKIELKHSPLLHRSELKKISIFSRNVYMFESSEDMEYRWTSMEFESIFPKLQNTTISYKIRDFNHEKHYQYFDINYYSYSSHKARGFTKRYNKILKIYFPLSRPINEISRTNGIPYNVGVCYLTVSSYLEFKEIVSDIKSKSFLSSCSQKKNTENESKLELTLVDF